MATLDKSHVVDVDLGAAAAAACSAAGGGGPRGQSTASRSDDDSSRSSEADGSVEIVRVPDHIRKDSFASACLVELDLEAGTQETKVHLAKYERDCRICHLSLDSANLESGIPIELGCSCKDDLAAAHKQCAEAWFKIRGNKTCEICGSVARNVIGANEAELMGQLDEVNDAATATAATAAPIQTVTRNFWQGHRLLNFLLACMVFAFVISWLFRFNVPS